MRILLLKPYQPTKVTIQQPPLGLLYLAATLRAKLGPELTVHVKDMRLYEQLPADFLRGVPGQEWDVVGISAMNFEAEATARLAQAVRDRLPEARVVLGGPMAHSNHGPLQSAQLFDWIFTGEADWAFPEAVARLAQGDTDYNGIGGLIWRNSDNIYVDNGPAAAIADLDAIPFPAWDLVDFKAYASRPNQNGNLKGARYAPVFTSRGCPYKCTYCHDIFGKKFRHRSAANVLAEMTLLREQYGVDEFHIVDDIFNLHKPRLKQICAELAATQQHICFPNGLRADILDQAGVQALADAGTYQVCVAIETVTPRLQDLVQKNLDLPKLEQAIRWFNQRGVLVKGFFMIGFPTETEAEIEDTVQWAIRSDLTFAGFYLVLPQRATALFDLAARENKAALEKVVVGDYYSASSWWTEAYGIDLQRIQRRAFRRFFLSRPWRIWRMLRQMRFKALVKGFWHWLRIVFSRGSSRTHSTDIEPALRAMATVEGRALP